MILCNDVSFSYESKRTLEHVSFKLDAGDSLAIIGPNGAGKSTLLKSLAGILEYEGNILLDGKEVRSMPKKNLAKMLAYLPQMQNTYAPITVKELVSFGRYPHLERFESLREKDEHIIEETMEFCGIGEFKDRLIANLSGGERQKVFLAKALAQKPEVLLLDEPVTYLDLQKQHNMLDLIHHYVQEQGILLISVIHDLNFAYRYHEKCMILKDSKVYKQGFSSEVLTEENIKEAFGIQSKFIEISRDRPPYIITDLTF